MKKIILSILICIISIVGYSQKEKNISLEIQLKKEKRIIYVNNKKNVSLFFPKPIRQGIIGANHFVFGYNQEIPNFLGIIKGTYGIESNLLVITTDGEVYSFIIRYAKKLSRFNYFIKQKESIGNENQNKKKEKKTKKQKDILENEDFETTFFNNKPPDTANVLYNTDRIAFYKKFSANLASTSGVIKIKKTVENITLSLKDIKYGNNELYFYMEIQNLSGVDYDVNFLNISTTNKNKKKRKSSQTILKKPIYVYKLYDRIKRKSIDRIVYVVPKFSINKQKKVIIELNEKQGERNISLKIDKKFINNPN